ncbi:hypothetical protein DOM22_01980 [Bdellovibrio sp. ZAP7]|nr:hypothetical protein DOM22_01980 [Bdellovibrio sp. ZAP7]
MLNRTFGKINNKNAGKHVNHTKNGVITSPEAKSFDHQYFYVSQKMTSKYFRTHSTQIREGSDFYADKSF